MITDITDTDGHTDNAAKDINERMLDHHPKKDLPLNNSVSPILPTTIPKLALIHDSKSPNDPSSTVNHSESPHTSNTGYIMSTEYSGFTGGGTGALLQLQCYVRMNALPMHASCGTSSREL